jgi:hypothetical protein
LEELKEHLKTVRGAKRELAKQRQRENFDQILLDAIDETFSSLGENVKTSVYFHLEDLFKIKKQEIPSKLSDFLNALEQIFGLGTWSLEIMFMRNLHVKIKVTCKWPEYRWPLSKWIVPEMTFQEYVGLLRQNFEAAKENKMEMEILADEEEELQK